MALDFLILYEHTVREYESDLLLKLELERRGYTAEIRQLLDPKHLRLFGKDKPEVLVASCMMTTRPSTACVQQYWPLQQNRHLHMGADASPTRRRRATGST